MQAYIAQTAAASCSLPLPIMRIRPEDFFIARDSPQGFPMSKKAFCPCLHMQNKGTKRLINTFFRRYHPY